MSNFKTRSFALFAACCLTGSASVAFAGGPGAGRSSDAFESRADYQADQERQAAYEDQEQSTSNGDQRQYGNGFSRQNQDQPVQAPTYGSRYGNGRGTGGTYSK